MYKVMIVGHGFVGSAIASLFSDEEKVIVDPKFTDNKISDNSGVPFDAVFVSVDTPKAEGFKLLDFVLSDLNEHVVKGTPVCCKSTASPKFYYDVCQKYNNIEYWESNTLRFWR